MVGSFFQAEVGEYVQIYGNKSIWNRCILTVYAQKQTEKVILHCQIKEALFSLA